MYSALDSGPQWQDLFFVEKYDLVGHLLKPGEDPADYTDTEEERSVSDRPKAEWLM